MKKILLILLCLPFMGFGQNISNKDIKKSEKLFQKGVKYYTKAVNQKEPRYYDFQSNSQKYDSKGNFQKAIEYFSESIELNPYFYQPYYFRGLCYLYEKTYNQSYGSSPGRSRIENVLNKEISTTRLNLALEDFKMIKKNTVVLYTHHSFSPSKDYNLINCYMRANEFIEPIEDYLNIISFDKNGLQKVFFKEFKGYYKYPLNCLYCFETIKDKRQIDSAKYSALINFNDGKISGNYEIKNEKNETVLSATDTNWVYYISENEIAGGDGSKIYKTDNFKTDANYLIQDGKIIKRFNYYDGSCGYTLFSYYPNGNLQSEVDYICSVISLNRDAVRTKSYYADKKEYEYYDNNKLKKETIVKGKLNSKHSRKIVKYFNEIGEMIDSIYYPSVSEKNSDKNTKETTKEKNEESWSGNGSGFFISKFGHIATNNHVIDRVSEIEVEFKYNNEIKSFKAKIIKVDKINDLAIIKIDDTKFSSLKSIPYSIKTRSSDVGTNVFALGYPLALSIMGKDLKFTDGKISSKTGLNGDITTYQIQVPIQPGSSGGPLFDRYGNLVGITSSGINRKLDLTENVNYAIKSSYLLNLVDVLPEKINLPSSTQLASKKLTEQIKILSDYVVLIKVR